MQITTGIRSVFSTPLIYSTFQYVMGAKKGWSYLADTHIEAKIGDNILDIGCGLADVLEYLPKVNYWGFDIVIAAGLLHHLDDAESLALLSLAAIALKKGVD